MTHYEFRIWQTSDGMDHASFGPFQADTRNGASMALARKVINGLDSTWDLPVRCVGLDGKPRLNCRSIYTLGGRTVTETANGGMRIVRHVPFLAARGG